MVNEIVLTSGETERQGGKQGRVGGKTEGKEMNVLKRAPTGMGVKEYEETERCSAKRRT